MNWISSPVVLRGNRVTLLPLETSHFDALIRLSKDQRIWEHYVLDGSDTATLRAGLEQALVEREKGTQYPFVITLQQDQTIIGSTRFLDLNREHRKLEVGWTWLSPEHWGSAVNAECKLLLFSYAFEQLGATRVQLKTDERNLRSRKAIEKTGAQFEGILRHDMIRANGTNRNSAYYSLIDSEWPEKKAGLVASC